MEMVGRVIFWIAILVLALVLLYMICRYWYFYRHEHFICPNCGNQWKPRLRVMLLGSVNAVEGKILRCPKCGEKEYMEPKRDQIETGGK